MAIRSVTILPSDVAWVRRFLVDTDGYYESRDAMLLAACKRIDVRLGEYVYHRESDSMLMVNRVEIREVGERTHILTVETELPLTECTKTRQWYAHA